MCIKKNWVIFFIFSLKSQSLESNKEELSELRQDKKPFKYKNSNCSIN